MNTPPLFFACWIRDGEWEVRVDGPHVNPPLGQRHVHVRRRKGRKGEYAWNIDGSRHDQGKFPVSEEGIGRARAIAADRLKVDASTLQLIAPFFGDDHGIVIIDLHHRRVYHRILTEGSARGVILANDDWLVVVCAEEPNAERSVGAKPPT